MGGLLCVCVCVVGSGLWLLNGTVSNYTHLYISLNFLPHYREEGGPKGGEVSVRSLSSLQVIPFLGLMLHILSSCLVFRRLHRFASFSQDCVQACFAPNISHSSDQRSRKALQ